MKNRILAVTISLCLIFCSVVPSYAVTESLVTGFSNPSLSNTVSAYQVMNQIVSYLANISASFTYDQSGNSPIDNILTDIVYLVSWLTPGAEEGLRPSGTPSLYQIVLESGTALYQYLPELPQIASYITSWMQSNNNYLNSLFTALSRQTYSYSDNWAYLEPYINSHVRLFFDRDTETTGLQTVGGYYFDFVNDSGSVNNTRMYYWQDGSPLGNIALMIQQLNKNIGRIYQFNWAGFLTGFNDTLTTWEHSTNTQTTFTPESLANGLYRYLAYIQSDTSALWYHGIKDYNKPLTRYTISSTNGTSFTPTSAYEGIHTFLQDLDTFVNRMQFALTYESPRSYGSGILSQIIDPITLTATNMSSSTYQGFTRSAQRILSAINLATARLAFVNADDNDIAAKRNSHNNEVAVEQSFMDPSGSGAATTSDFGTLASASGSVKTNFNTGVSASGVFDVFNQSYDWFSQTTANNLDTVSSGSRLSKKGVNEYETTYLDDYYKEIYSLIEDHPIETYEFIEDQPIVETYPILGE